MAITCEFTGTVGNGMTRAEQLKADIAVLDDNIRRGLEFERQGYGAGLMIGLTKVLRDKLKAELAGLEGL